MTVAVTVSEKGLVLPEEIREKANLKNGDRVTVSEKNGVIVIKKARTIFDIAGSIKVSADFDTRISLLAAQKDIADEKLSRD
ncbi:MAG: AbrB/MazE/SpoVT family DNA-binding domain-containing protein [Spirochaetia bacterium]|jgi:AbrB family looped-hinge helix DNA binding protein|nr:AbrB/MazE/SpoVT family DNA-binding domain-containing protein [Spirochaetia bacterium]